MQIGQLFARVVKAVDFRKCLQPRLTALLSHDAVRSPRRQRVVEPFVGRTHRHFCGHQRSRIVEAGQVTHTEIGCRRHHPGVGAAAHRVGKAAIIFEQEKRMRAQRRVYRTPVDCVYQIDVEVRDHRLPVTGEIGRRGKVSLLHVLHLRDQGLLRRASRTRVRLNRALIDHHGKREAGMLFGLRHDQLSGVVDGIIRPVPVDDHPIDAAADHVRNLVVDLNRIV